jgi:hypothetical protein
VPHGNAFFAATAPKTWKPCAVVNRSLLTAGFGGVGYVGQRSDRRPTIDSDAQLIEYLSCKCQWYDDIGLVAFADVGLLITYQVSAIFQGSQRQKKRLYQLEHTFTRV